MIEGILAALTLFAALVLEHGLFSALPQPWNVYSFTLVLGAVLMYRKSLPLGAVFLMLAGVTAFTSGLIDWPKFLGLSAAALAGVLLSMWVFARRSLVALAGFMLGVTLAYIVTTLLATFLAGALFPEQVGGQTFSLGECIWLLIMNAFSSILFSLVYTRLVGTFGGRFMQKNVAYEIQKNI